MTNQVGVAEKLVELVRSDELVPVVGPGWHEMQDVLGGDDGAEPRPRCAVDGGHEERAA